MARRPTLPLVHSLELSRPLAPLRALAGLPHPFMLHSALPDARPEGLRRARWSFFGADPFAVFRGGDHLAAIETWRRIAERAPHTAGQLAPGVPFSGGAVGYWAYDYARRLETVPSLAIDDLGLPDFVMAFYDVVGAYDHDTQQTWLFSSGLPLEGEAAVVRAEERLAQVRARILAAGRAPLVIERAAGPLTVRGTFDEGTWRAAVLRVQEHIRRGDIFQANVAQRWRIDRDDALALAPALYESLTQVSPAPFAAYLGLGDHALLSASPERFLELRGDRVQTRPIKGTRPRGAMPGEDDRLAAELEASAKDRAENIMIVDVLRNDLGRVCEHGTITAPALCELERFPQVMHLTSTVTGRLRPDVDAFDVLHACFPGGSITGAPKLRAMEIIEAIEPVRRHAYTGALGWVGWDGDADWSIVIRTATATASGLVFHAGGGITADSDPDAEYRETLDKAEGIRRALCAVLGEIRLGNGAPGLVTAVLPPGVNAPARVVWINGHIVRGADAVLSVFDRGARDGGGIFETVRVYDGRPFAWQRHLERLVLSAAELGFPVPPAPAQLRQAIDELLAAQRLADAVVRLTVTRGIAGGRPTRAGAWIEAGPLAARLWPGKRRGGARAMFSRAPFQQGWLGRHKTTSRLAWDLAREEARAAGADEALLVSREGHVLEGAASNVFLVRDGEVLTPPLAQDVLPGITRAIVLELCRELGLRAREAPVAAEQLRGAEEVFLTNSVQEVLPVAALEGRATGPRETGTRLLAAYRERVARER